MFDQDKYALEKYTQSLLKIYQNKRTESIEILNSINNNNIDINDKIKYDLSYLYLMQGKIENALEALDNTNENSAFTESALLLKAEIYDHILNNKTEAVAIYLFLLDNFPNSIHYEAIRLRLRDLAS